MARVVGLLVLAVATLGAAPNRSAITRLDGSRISGAQIDQTVARLMQAAEVPVREALRVAPGSHLSPDAMSEEGGPDSKRAAIRPPSPASLHRRLPRGLRSCS